MILNLIFVVFGCWNIDLNEYEGFFSFIICVLMVEFDVVKLVWVVF